MSTVSLASARKIALAAQGFLDPVPAQVTRRHLLRVMDRVKVVQVDSVNVLTRAHYLPFFARLGAYDPAVLDSLTNRRPWPLVESWAHMASFIRAEHWDLLEFRRAGARQDTWSGLERVLTDDPGVEETVTAAFAQGGPMTARECADYLGWQEARARERSGWNWSAIKTVTEYLFHAGVLVSTGRNTRFERVYDLSERVLTPSLVSARPDPQEARLELVRLAAQALGIATPASLGDYFRLRAGTVKAAVAELVRLGELEPVEVDGLGEHLLWTGARRPRKADARALLSPFDSLIWHRERTLELFGMHYRIGIYTPREQRTHGYYVLPFLLGDELVARVDLKADRAAGRLRVQQLTWEPHAPRTAPGALDELLHEMAAWLSLDAVTYP